MRLQYRDAVVAGHGVRYLCGGSGPSVVFLHGWGLAGRTYSRALAALIRRGVRVYAPTMPGFGGTAGLTGERFSLAGYAQWIAEFIRSVNGPPPVTVIGHSFGGGVAIRVAHDVPGLVNRLVLVNSIGGSAWTNGKGVLVAMRERPVWNWGLHLRADLIPTRQMTRVLPVILRDGLLGIVRNPGAVWRAGHLARTADLTGELAELKRRRLPTTIVWSNHDDVIPAAAIGTMCAAAGDAAPVTVPGNHSWLLADPHRFGEVITNVLTAVDAMTAPPAIASDNPLEAA